jgi:hypothetical protein
MHTFLADQAHLCERGTAEDASVLYTRKSRKGLDFPAPLVHRINMFYTDMHHIYSYLYLAVTCIDFAPPLAPTASNHESY